MSAFVSAQLIGLDWATLEQKRGFAFADLHADGTIDVRRVGCFSRKTPAVEIVASAVRANPRTLLAIDAPLGWPVGLAVALANHSAGEGLAIEPVRMFSRATDRFVQEKTGKRPLEIGANLIARAAHSAVVFLDDLRTASGLTIPLAWNSADVHGPTAIEVYPAATRITYGSISPVDELKLPEPTVVINEHARDALWCVIAARDFLLGKCFAPVDTDVAKREGWIWFRDAER